MSFYHVQVAWHPAFELLTSMQTYTAPALYKVADLGSDWRKSVQGLLSRAEGLSTGELYAHATDLLPPAEGPLTNVIGELTAERNGPVDERSLADHLADSDTPANAGARLCRAPGDYPIYGALWNGSRRLAWRQG